MAKSAIVSAGGAGVAVTDNTTRFASIGNMGFVSATESDVESPVRDAGVFSKFYAYVNQNDVGATSTITLRKSRADTALVLSYTSSQTGIKEDTSNTSSFAATDEISYEITVPSVSGTHTVTVALIGVQFEPTASGDSISLFVDSFPTGRTVSVASTTVFWPPNGGLTSGALEADCKFRIRSACTASDLFTNVLTNGRTTDTVVRTRNNGANGNQLVTYTSGQTGQKEDTSNTDSLAAGDDYNYSTDTSTGTGNFILMLVSTSLISTGGAFFLMLDALQSALVFNSTRNYGVAGRSGSATEADNQYRPQFNFTGDEFSARVTTNTIATSPTTIKVRVGGANVNGALSYAAGETGLKTDTSNTDAFVSATSLINYQIITPNTSGQINPAWIGMLGLTSTISTQTQLGQARIQKSVSQTQLGKTRIQKLVTQTQLGKSAINVSSSQTQLGKSRITATATQTQLGRARIQATSTQTQLGKSRIQITSTQTQQGLSRITISTSRTQLGLSRITGTTARTQLGRARIQITSTATQLGKANILLAVTATQLGKSRITATTPRTQLGVSRITATTSRTQLGLSRIQRTASSTQLGRSRITATVPQTQLGKSRITALGTRTQLGQSRITATTTRTQLGRSRISISTSRTQQGRSRLQLSTSRTQLGKANLVIQTTRTQLGVANILPSPMATQDQLGRARIQITSTATQLGRARIQRTVAPTQLGLSRINGTVSATQLGVASIVTYIQTSQTQLGVARIVHFLIPGILNSEASLQQPVGYLADLTQPVGYQASLDQPVGYDAEEII